jgi:hypothetical protein
MAPGGEGPASGGRIIASSESPGRGPGDIVGSVPGWISIAGTVDYSPIVCVRADVAGSVPGIDYLWIGTIYMDIPHVVQRAGWRDGVDLFGHLDGHGPGSVGAMRDEPDRLVATVV